MPIWATLAAGRAEGRNAKANTIRRFGGVAGVFHGVFDQRLDEPRLTRGVQVQFLGGGGSGGQPGDTGQERRTHRTIQQADDHGVTPK